jgi:DNA-binding PadR family transcriptional regulator
MNICAKKKPRIISILPFRKLASLLILRLGINYYPIRPIDRHRCVSLHHYSEMKKYQLGEFEEVVMLTVGILYKDAYGVSIKKEIETRLSRKVSVGALQTALKRLEQKGYLKSHEGEPTPERAGRPKRYFAITAYGRKAVEYTRTTREQLWRAIPKVALNVKIAG